MALPINVLFWNLNKKPLQGLLANLCRELGVDIVILGECTVDYDTLALALNTDGTAPYTLVLDPLQRRKDLILLTRLPNECVRPLRDDGRLTIKRVIPPVGSEFLLVAAHLSSKLYVSSEEQAQLSTRYARLIEEAENLAGHTRTVFVGDLNMNPFEAGLVGGEALHAVMSKKVALKGERTVCGQPRRYFYNPMWAHYAGDQGRPGGTYYHDNGRVINYYWNIFDQILLRPAMLPHFNDHELHIITNVGGTSLLNANGTPDSTLASDHLPISFTLHI